MDGVPYGLGDVLLVGPHDGLDDGSYGVQRFAPCDSDGDGDGVHGDAHDDVPHFRHEDYPDFSFYTPFSRLSI